MESEEWNFLLNFAQNLNDSIKHGDNTDGTQEDAEIGNIWRLIFRNTWG